MRTKNYRRSATLLILACLLPATLGACASETGQTTTTTGVLPTTPLATTTATTTPPPPTTTTTTALPPTTTATATSPASKVIFADDFNNETNGANPSKWTVVEPEGTDLSIDDTVYFGTSGKSARMQDTSATGAPSINRIIGTQTGKFWYQISIRLAQTNQIIGGAYIGTSTVPAGTYGIENLGVSIAFWSDGYIKYNDNDNNLLSWQNVQAYQADKWYTIKILVDVPNQRINLYIDDVLKLTDIRFRYPVTSLDQITAVGRVEIPAATVWIDNVLVTEGP